MNLQESDLSFELLPRTEEAARLVFDWRNDPSTVKNSFSGKEKTWPAFLSEYLDGYFLESALPGYFILLNGKRCGIIGCTRAESWENNLATATVSINIAPASRGKKIAGRALAKYSQQAKAHGLDVLVAEIFTDNLASIKAFEKAGYKHNETYQRAVLKESRSVGKFVHVLKQTFSTNGRRYIGEGEPCYIIAEAGSNWKIGNDEENQKTARKLIDVAKEAGADAVKFQTFRAETTYVSNAGDSDYLRKAGEVKNVFELIADLEMPYAMVDELEQYAKKKEIDFLTTAFSVKDLNAIDKCVAMHKIASYENTHMRLLEAAAKTGKPVIMSTGASSQEEIQWSVEYWQSLTSAPMVLMQCTASYPAPPGSIHLRTLHTLKSRYGLLTGFSDHSRNPINAPVAAVALGASVIEKHFTLKNDLPGPDHRYAVEPHELKAMVEAIRNTEELLGDPFKKIDPVENELYVFAKRALQATKDINEGDVLKEGQNFDILRPGSMPKGIHPKYASKLEATKSKKRIRMGEGLELSLLSE